MSTAVRIEHKDVEEIPFQEASLDIWDRKYRLTAKDGAPIDATMDDTLARVARTLADVEEPAQREALYERFLWALRKGAIPAGRIMSNAGAQDFYTHLEFKSSYLRPRYSPDGESAVVRVRQV